jgi:hypothetical protein
MSFALFITLYGRGLLSHLLVADDIRAGRFRSLMLAFPPRRFPLSVVYPSRRNLPPRVRTVIEFLKELLCSDPEMTGDGQVPIESDAPPATGMHDHSNPVRRFERAAQQIRASPHVFHPADDKKSEAKIRARLKAF